MFKGKSREEPPEKVMRSDSIVLAGAFISEENSEELSSMVSYSKLPIICRVGLRKNWG